MHIGPIFRFHFIDSYHSELPEVTTSYNQRKTQNQWTFQVHMLNDVISEEKILKYFGQQEIIMYPPIIGCHIKNKNSIE
jgi:hypothetical protein